MSANRAKIDLIKLICLDVQSINQRAGNKSNSNTHFMGNIVDFTTAGIHFINDYKNTGYFKASL